MNPLVSAIIPAFNAEPFIKAAIDSVLAQTWQPMECIVVDDGSTDGTADRVMQYGDKVQLLRKPNGGVATARNLGVAHARGEFVAFLDADDVWLPEKIAKQVSLFNARPELGMVYSGVIVADAALNPIGALDAVSGERALFNTLTQTAPGVPVTMTGMLRRDVYLSAGGFDEQFRKSADLDFVCRVAMQYPIAPVSEPLAIYRQHEGQMHLNLKTMERDMLRIFDKLFADPRMPEALRGLKGRARTKLYYSLALSYVRRRDLRESARCALIALRRPDLIVRFLSEGVRRRLAASPGTEPRNSRTAGASSGT